MSLKYLFDMMICWIVRTIRHLVRCASRVTAVSVLALAGTTIAIAPSVCRADLPQGVRVVDWQAEGTPDGLTWATAFTTLQDALDDASLGGVDQIWVAVGTYVPSNALNPNEFPNFVLDDNSDDENRQPTFLIPKNVGLYGGFLGNAHPFGGEESVSEADPFTNITILSGDLLGTIEAPDPDDVDDPEDPSTFNDNAYHILFYYQDNDDNEPPDPEQMIVDGFVITGGNANGGADTSPYYNPLNALGGGALIVYEAHFFELGESADPDFAMALAPVFSRCVFQHNFAELGGGAIAGVYNGGRVIDCTFINNQQFATSGTTFGGKNTRGGGAINVLGPMAILKSTFIENESVAAGGAVLDSGPVTENDVIVVSNCVFRENTAPGGGGVSTLQGPVVNCLFVGNSVDIDGGAIKLFNCTFIANQSASAASPAMPVPVAGPMGSADVSLARNDAWTVTSRELAEAIAVMLEALSSK